VQRALHEQSIEVVDVEQLLAGEMLPKINQDNAELRLMRLITAWLAKRLP
jgi:hypothetical protein